MVNLWGELGEKEWEWDHVLLCNLAVQISVFPWTLFPQFSVKIDLFLYFFFLNKYENFYSWQLFFFFFFLLQHSELDSITELFHLLEIKTEELCDRDTNYENESKYRRRRSSSDDRSTTEEVGSSVSQTEEDEECLPNRSRRRSSSIPINLSVPNKIDSKSTSLSIDRNVSKVCLNIFQRFH